MERKESAQRFAALVPRKARNYILLCGGLLLFGIIFFWANDRLAAEDKAQGGPPGGFAMPVETTEVVVDSASREIYAVGSLKSNESVVMSSEIAGRVTAINFEEGQGVAKGQVLIRLDDSVLKAELDQAEANRVLSAANYKRATALLTDRAISEQERDEAFARWQLDEARVRLAQAQFDKTVLCAPFSGTLGLRQISVGDYIQPGQYLVNLEDDARLKVEFKIPESDAPKVKINQKFAMRTDAYPERTFAGAVYAVNPKLEQQSRSLVLRGIIDNSDKSLHSGQFVKVSLVVGATDNAIFIPEQAIVPQPKRLFVFKVVEGKVSMVEVTIGKRKSGWVEIASGLQPGDVVVTGGIQKIGDGMPVKAIPADPELFAAQKNPGQEG